MERPPINTKFNLKNIPQELQKIPQWVSWKPEWNEGKGKYNKVPKKGDGTPASHSDPKTWDTLENVTAAINGGERGIGFVLTEMDGIVGIDLDNCRDPDTGEIEGWAVDIIKAFNTYTEVSPSGTGIRMFIKGMIPKAYLSGAGSGRKKDNVEAYHSLRFLTVTGDHVADTLNKLNDCQGALENFMEEHFGKVTKKTDVDLGDGEIEAQEVDDAFFDRPEVQAWWERKCADLSDPSASNYDARLAHLVGDAGMGIGHFKMLVCMWREKHKEKPEKAERDDYIRRTWDLTGRNVDGVFENMELPENINPNFEEHRLLVDKYRKQQLKAFGERHGLVNIEGQARLVYKKFRAGYITEDGDIRHGYHRLMFSPKDSANMLYANQKIPCIYQTPANVGTEKWSLKRENIFAAWLNWDERKTFNGVEMVVKPGMIDNTLNIPDPESTEGVFNMYLGTAYSPREGKCDLIKEHILNVWCDGRADVASYVFGWLGCLYTQPQTLLPALVLRSGEGTGKGILIDGLQDSWGGHQFVATKADDITGDFNDFLATSVFVYLNEAVWGGYVKDQGSLKSLITDKKHTMNRKYVPRTQVDNYCHLIVSTNEEWVVPVGVDDRRFVFLDVAEHRVGDREYFRALKKEINDGGIAVLMFDVMHMENLKGFDPWVIPKGISAAKADNKLMSAKPCVKWIHEALECGEFMDPGGYSTTGYVSCKSKWPDEELKFYREQKSALLGNYDVRYNRPARASSKLTQNRLIRFLKKAVGADVVESKGPERPGYWTIPPLGQARANFEKFIGEDMGFED